MPDKKNNLLYKIKKLFKLARRKTQYFILYIFLLGILKIFALFPEHLVYFICEKLAELAFLIMKKDRLNAINNLNNAFPDNTLNIYETAKNSFINLGRNAAEFIIWEKLTHDELKNRITANGIEHLTKASDAGKGVLIVSAHCGNWELVAAYVIALNFKGKVIARKVNDARIDSLLRKKRESKGYKVIDRDAHPREILKELKSHNMIGILADQDIPKIDGVFVNFFGRPAYTPTAPVVIALTSKCAVVPCCIARDPKRRDKHIITFYPELKFIDNKKDKEALIKNTQMWTDIIESHIRKYPDQWVWMHKRWKTTPEKIAQKMKDQNQ